jgi:hypothetical protein
VATALALCINMSSDTDAVCVATALALCINMSSDTDALCVATALALCLKRKIFAARPHNATHKTTTHTRHSQTG